MLKVRIKMYDGIKYNSESKKFGEIFYDVESFEVVKKTDAELSAEGFDEFDPFNEYLVLKFSDGTTATFRNSFVDMFRA